MMRDVRDVPALGWASWLWLSGLGSVAVITLAVCSWLAKKAHAIYEHSGHA
jgi:hypothetical protein